MLVYGAGAAFYGLELEPAQFGRGWSRLWDLRLTEPELPKKVVAPQHWLEPKVFFGQSRIKN